MISCILFLILVIGSLILFTFFFFWLVWFEQLFSPADEEVIFPLKGHLAIFECLETFFFFLSHLKECNWHLVNRSTDVLSILQCTGRSTQQITLQPKLTLVLRLINPGVLYCFMSSILLITPHIFIIFFLLFILCLICICCIIIFLRWDQFIDMRSFFFSNISV